MAQLNYLSPDKRVNQQVSANTKTDEIRVNHFINLKVQPLDNPQNPDLDDVYLVSCETLSEDVKAEKADYEDLMKANGFKPQIKGRITIFKYQTIGKVIDSDRCIPLPKNRPYWMLSRLPHTVITLLSPTGGASSTAKGEAL